MTTTTTTTTDTTPDSPRKARKARDGVYKRCGCSDRKWTKCAHPWHFDFYKGRKFRFSIAKLSKKTGYMSKGDAEALRDHYRSQIRDGIFQDPNRPDEVPPDVRLTFGDVADRYLKRHVQVPTRRAQPTYAIECHIEMLKRAEVPAAHGRTITLADKCIEDITKSDVEAIREWRRAVALTANTEREQWLTEKAQRAKQGKTMDRPMPRLVLARVKGGEVGINRLLARLRHLFTWAIAEGYIEKTPFRREGVTVVKLATNAESPRDRRLAEGEEQALLKHASPDVQALLIAALSTGCRPGELLSLQWKQVQHVTGPDGEPMARYLVLPAGKTKTSKTRLVPVSTRLRAVLAMRRNAPDGKPLGDDAYIFGYAVGEFVKSRKTAWRAACRRAGIFNLQTRDLRREFGSVLLESSAGLHIVRDYLGHANITTTSRYLATTPLALEHAMSQLEEHQKNSHKVVTSTTETIPETAASDSREVVKQ